MLDDLQAYIVYDNSHWRWITGIWSIRDIEMQIVVTEHRIRAINTDVIRAYLPICGLLSDRA